MNRDKPMEDQERDVPSLDVEEVKDLEPRADEEADQVRGGQCHVRQQKGGCGAGTQTVVP